MSAVSRRGLFGLFAGALATPVLAKLSALDPAAFATAPSTTLSLSDIVTFTLRNRSATIADNLMRTNPLFARLAATSTVPTR